LTITFTIPGKPFAKQRPRMTRQGRAFTPAATVSFERTVGQYAMEAIPSPIKGPVKVEVLATFEPAASWSKKKTAEHIGRHHIQRPDADNLMKAILDGMNRIAFDDDAQVAVQHVSKVWGPEARTVVMVTPLDWEAAA
jgi:Holliday junction resolvase RusA-like endonuclease